MTHIFIGAFLAVVLVAVAEFFVLRSLKASLKTEREKSAALSAAVTERDRTIKTIQEAHHEQTERTAQISTGSPADRVAGSLGVLSDIAKAGSARRKN